MFSNTIRSMARFNAAQPSVYQQISKLNRLTPISCYHQNFHRKDETINRKTGFMNETYSPLNLHKSIHSHSALFLKNSKLLDQKASGDGKKIEKDDKDAVEHPLDALEEGKKLGLIARFKKMTKDYWYVLIPVHCFTSCFWFGAFYYTSVR